jgi:hypothetical protein
MAVPDNFTVSLIEINHLFDSGEIDFCDSEDTSDGRQSLYEDVLKQLEELKKGNMVWQEDFKYREAFSFLVECLKTNNLEIKSVDTSGDGDYKIIPVTQKMLVKIITQISIYDGNDIMTNIINKQGKKNEE